MNNNTSHTQSSASRSALRHSRYTSTASTASNNVTSTSTASATASRILLDGDGFPIDQHQHQQSSSQSSSQSQYSVSSHVSTADEILKRVQESRMRRAAASASSNQSGVVGASSVSSLSKNASIRSSSNNDNSASPVTPNTLRTLEVSRQKNKALAMEYGMALESSKARMQTLERELSELNEFKSMEQGALMASSLQYNEVQQKLEESERKHRDLHEELVRMQNSHQIQQNSLSSTLELAKAQSEDDQQRIVYLENQVNSLHDDLKTVSMENDPSKFVKLTVTEHKEILSVLKANTEKIRSLEFQNRGFQSQNTQLQKQHEESLAEFQNTLKDLEKFHSDVYNEKDSSLRNTQEEIGMLQNKIDQYIVEINQKNDTITDLEKQISDQEVVMSDVGNLQEELSNAKEELIEVESRAKTRVNFYEDKIKTSKSSSDDAERTAREIKIRNKVLEVELREQKANISKRDELIIDMKSRLQNLEQDVEAAGTSKAIIESHATKIELLTQNNKLLSAKEISLSRCIKHLENQVVDLKKKLAEIEDENNQLKQSSVDETALHDDIGRLESKMTDAQKSLTREKEKCECLEKQLNDVEIEATVLRKERDNLKIQRRHVEGLLQEAKSENDHIRNHQIARLMEENHKINEQLSALQIDKQSMEATLELYNLNLEDAESSANEKLSSEEEDEKTKILDGALFKYMTMNRTNVVEEMIQKT